MADNPVIKIKGGTEPTIPNGYPRELMVTTDTNNLYVGKGTLNAPVLIADSTIPGRVTTIENQLSTFYVSARDTFNDESMISTNTNLTVSNSLIRPSLTKYVENMTGDISIDTGNSRNISSTGGDIEQIVNTVGDLPYGYSGVTGVEEVGIFQTNTYSFPSSTSFSTTPVFNTSSTSATDQDPYIRMPQTYETLSLAVEHLMDIDQDSSFNQVTGILEYLGSGSPTAGRLLLKRLSPTRAVLASRTVTLSELFTLNTATIIKNLAVKMDDNFVYVAFTFNFVNTTTNLIKVKRYNKSDFSDAGEWIPTIPTGVTPASTHQIHGCDLAIQNGRLHLIYNYRLGATGTITFTQYAFCNIASFGTTVGTVELFRCTTAEDIFSARLCAVPNDNLNRVGWLVSTDKSSLGLCFGIIDSSETTSPWQFRGPLTPPAGATTAGNRGLVINVSASGICDLTYDPAKDQFYGVFNGTSGTDIRAFSIPAGVKGTTATASVRTAITTPAEYSTVGKRAIRILTKLSSAGSGTTVHIVWTNSARSILYYNEFNFAAYDGSNSFSPSFSNFVRLMTTTSNQIGAIVASPGPVGGNVTPIQIYVANLNTISNIRQEHSIRTELYVALLDTNNSVIGLEQKCTSGVANQWTLGTARTAVKLRYRFSIPLYYNSADPPGMLSARLTQYTLERTTGAQNAGFGEFVTVPLITDRLIKQVTLTAAQNIGTTPGNNITWEVQALDNGTWYNITPGVPLAIPQAGWGSQLRLKARLDYGSGVTDITTAPNILEYTVSVTSVLTNNDILPLQIDVMKLGINVKALASANRYDYKNMMIDTFQSSTTGVTASGSWSWSNDTFSVGSGGSAVLTSTIETADITAVTNMLVVAEASIVSGGSMTLEVSRDGGSSWFVVTKESPFTFATNTAVKNQVRIRATLTGVGTQLFGWAYLYN